MRRAAALAALAAGAGAAELHVDARGGSDAADGSAGSPLRSIAAAQQAARRLRRQGHAAVDVHVSGSHQLGATLELGPEDAGVSWRAAHPGAAVHGGAQVPVSAFKPWKDGILVADLSGMPGLQLGQVQGSAGLGSCANAKAELYFNGERQVLARYPNIGSDGFWVFLNAAKESADGSAVIMDDGTAKRAAGWTQEKDLWVHGYWKFDWADGYGRVSAVTLQNKSLMIDPKTPLVYNQVLHNARWYAVNALSELDAAGEYYIDRSSKQLYFKPPGGALKDTDSVMLSNLTTVMTVRDTSGVRIEGLEVRYGSSTNLMADNVSDSRIRDCNLGCTGGHALWVHGTRNQVVNNTARWTGCRGFNIEGGDLRTLSRGDNLVEGNTIEFFSAWKRTYMPALAWGGVGNTYRGNIIRNGPHTAAQGGGNDNVFDGNTFDTLAYEVDDTGAWYAGRSWAKRNNTLINNVFKNVKNVVKTYLGSPSVQAVYNDDQLSDNSFINNTFIDCHVGLFLGGGRHHTATGNKFIRCGTPLHIDARGLTWQKDYCTPPGGHFFTELNSLDYTHPPYSTHYPELLNITTDSPCVPVHNRIADSLWCGSEKFHDFSDKDQSAWHVTLSNNVKQDSLCQ
eukprot:TRINITY_DN21140_c0_g1_i1.p1 TRINITY_DN21140_c0_g1~~TRINITY_DN21140_c0_g1_i1.p1  ORF type:complete len:644 (+),score=255.68 TRINITY_DN21140_c0_g1_i1:65-1933(+)